VSAPRRRANQLTVFSPNFASLAVFLIVVVGGGIAIGVFTAPGAWYAGLAKPFFNPPAWIFGPVWTILYVIIAVAGWRIWQLDPASLAMKVWYAQMILNFAWSPVFFSAQRIDAAFGVIILLFIAIAAFILTAWHQDRISALLFLPYAMWVGFASALNGSILYLNPPNGG
jgi:tryptophan-rich sensory protein